MDWIIIILLLLFGFSTQPVVEEPCANDAPNCLPPTVTPLMPDVEGTPMGGEDTPTFVSLNAIDDVQVNVLESMPMQITLDVRSSIPDGCDFPVKVTQRREGNTIYVEIYRDVPLAAMCPAVQITDERTIALEGTFEPGSYIIDVNGTRLDVQL